MDTQQRILQAAREKFNSEGYSHVTLRAIAADCGIALGNLTYHYPHKMDLVQALLDDTFGQTLPSQEIRSLEALMEQFNLMLTAIQRNAFYFLDDEFGGTVSEHHLRIRQRLSEGVRYLCGAGYFTPAFDAAQQQAVLDVLLMGHMNWVRRTMRGYHAMTQAEFLRLHWRMFKPYLTEQGMEVYRRENLHG